jgi:hypothetical protein
MVYYIRFLSGPGWNAKSRTVSGALAVSSDLRERLLSQNVTLTISVLSSASDSTVTSTSKHQVEWRSGSYAVKFSIQLPLSTPAQSVTVYASADDSLWWNCLSAPLLNHFPHAIVPVCSTLDESKDEDSTTRLFLLHQGKKTSKRKLLRLIEWKRESILGHIWWDMHES